MAHIGAEESSDARGPRLAVNIGTGFGAAFALPDKNGIWQFGATEAGHMRLPMMTSSDAAVLDGAHNIEDVLSGQGVRRLAERLARHDGRREANGANPFEDDDEPARQALVMVLSRIIGMVAGDLVLATGAWGGVYFCGSVAQAWIAAMGEVSGAGHAFRSCFTDKGKMHSRMASVRAAMICVPDPGVMGLTYGADAL